MPQWTPAWAMIPTRRCLTGSAAHAARNLSVVDGSPFPTATGANPTLTIMASAWRVAEHVLSSRGSPD